MKGVFSSTKPDFQRDCGSCTEIPVEDEAGANPASNPRGTGTRKNGQPPAQKMCTLKGTPKS